MSQEENQSGQQIPQTPKKDYATPMFIKYGSVSKLTRGGGLSGTDSMMMMMGAM
jgi:hypothetical protein